MFFVTANELPCNPVNYIDSIRSLFDSNQLSDAEDLANKAIHYYQSDPDSLILAHLEKVRIYEITRKPRESVAAINQVEDLADEILENNSILLGYIYNIKGNLLSKDGSLRESAEYFKKAISILEGNESEIDKLIEVYATMTRTLFLQDLYEEAIEVGEIALQKSLMRYDTFDIPIPIIFKNLSNVYTYQGKYSEGLHYAVLYKKCMEDQFHSDHINVGIAYTDVALVHIYLGQYEKALAAYERAHNIFLKDHLKTGNNRYLGYIFQVMGQVYYRLGENQIGLDYNLRALDLKIQDYGPDHMELYYVYLNLVDFYNSLERYDEALKQLNHIYRIMEENGEPFNNKMVGLNHSKAGILFDLNDYEKSRDLYLINRRFLESKNREITLYGLNTNLGLLRLFIATGEYEKASEYSGLCRIAIDSLHGLYSGSYAEWVYYHSELLIRQQQIDSAYHFITDYFEKIKLEDSSPTVYSLPEMNRILMIFTSASKILYKKSLRGDDVNSELEIILNSFEKYYARKITNFRNTLTIQDESSRLDLIYSNVILTVLQNGQESDQLEEALQYLETFKSLLLRIVNNHKLIAQSYNENNLPQAYQDIYIKDQALKDSIRKYNTLIQEASSSIPEYMSGLAIAVENYQSFKDSLRSVGSDYFKEKYNLKASGIEEIEQILEENEVMLEYFFTDSLLITFIYSKGNELEISFTDAEPIRSALKNGVTRALSEDKSKLNSLFQDLIPDNVKGLYNKWLIIPDRELFYLNFDMLVDEEGEYLIKKHKFRYAYSASLLILQNNLKSSDKNSLDIISFVPGFDEELKQKHLLANDPELHDTVYLNLTRQPFMMSLLEGIQYFTAKNYTGEFANEINFKGKDHNCTVLYFGTHGETNDQTPLFSRLMLAKDELNDGYLHAYEIYNSTLNADLAVLSACKTGQGKISHGEGILSLAHAFTYAGVPATMMTLWDVDEQATAQILDHFFQNLNNGYSKSEALQKAKINFLNESPGELQDPYYWAGLVLIGNDSPVALSTTSNLNLYLIFSLFFLVTSAFFIKKWRKTKTH